MSERKASALNCYLTIVILITGVTCDVKFPYNDNLCLNQLVEYQCTVTGSSSGLLFLIWKILREDGTLLGSATYVSGSSQSEQIIGGVFTVEQLSQSPLISNISFTVQSSINGYTISCEDSGTEVMESSIIQVYDNSPDNVTIHTDTFTNSSVNISWTESPSPCVTGYRYNISSSALEEIIIMESTSNSVMVEGLVPSDDQYCVVVTAIDTANTTSSGSDPVCFLFNVPPTPIMITATSITVSDVTDNISLTWTFEYEMTSCAQVPVMNFVVSIFNTMNDSMEVIDESEEVPFDVTSFMFEDIPKGQNYTAEVFAVNVVGDGDSIRKFFQGVTCDVKFPYNNNFCLNQLVEYQCTVTGSSSGLLFLTWKILREDRTLLDSAITYISGSSQSEEIIGGVFTVEQLSQSPLISNISFTVQSSINGYTIICEDSGTEVMESSIIQVYDNSPDNVTIHTDTFTNSSVNISWTESPSPCVTGYRYNISSSALEENIIMESTSNIVMVDGIVPSDDQYCVVVTAIDTANRTSSGSDPVCFILKGSSTRTK